MLTSTAQCLLKFPYISLTKKRKKVVKKTVKSCPKKLLLTSTLPVNTTHIYIYIYMYVYIKFYVHHTSDN